jgi:hypothetical protein
MRDFVWLSLWFIYQTIQLRHHCRFLLSLPLFFPSPLRDFSSVNKTHNLTPVRVGGTPCDVCQANHFRKRCMDQLFACTGVSRSKEGGGWIYPSIHLLLAVEAFSKSANFKLYLTKTKPAPIISTICEKTRGCVPAVDWMSESISRRVEKKHTCIFRCSSSTTNPVYVRREVVIAFASSIHNKQTNKLTCCNGNSRCAVIK